MHEAHPFFERIVYVFQGGGALGAYQVGVFEALHENGYEPDWVIGTSIGAVNASIIAGNEPCDRVPKLKEFWNKISLMVVPSFKPQDEFSSRWFNYLSAQQSLLFGLPNFFYPRLNNPIFAYNDSADKISFYTTNPLRETLEEFVNFDRINQGKTRLTLGAVEVCCGIPEYFDNTKQTIKVDHVLASCALPPAFPAVEIDGKLYWDGGVLSNTPLHALLNDPCPPTTLCVMANLFDSYGLNPKTLDDVLKRHKDILYSSQYRQLLQAYRENQQLRLGIHRMYKKMPDDLKQDPILKTINDMGCDKVIHFVRFLYAADSNELSTKDFEFSKLSMDRRLASGYRDGIDALEKSPWLEPITEDIGIAIHEICQNQSALGMIN
ncbi:TPA: patatin-like phospholipase family protein [Legionella pneumophila]